LGAEEALEYFESRSLDDNFDNEIIFLDINMPCMNGWEFLDQYKKANSYDSPNSKIIMLTTSINPDDRQKADEYTNVYGFYNKPLSGQIIAEIVDQYFV
jgi:CheY-like chemotaxis protein